MSTKKPDFEYTERDWDYPLDIVEGRKGTSHTFVLTPEEPYLVQRLMFVAEQGQDIRNVMVTLVTIGNRLQPPFNKADGAGLQPVPASEFCGKKLDWDWCKRGQRIRITVRFLEDTKIMAQTFGRSVVSDPKSPW